MKYIRTILAALLLCAPAQAQTLKSLMFNSTNGQVVANRTNTLRFNVESSSGGVGFYDVAEQQYSLLFPSDDIVQLLELRWNDPSVRTSLGLGATNSVDFSSVTASTINVAGFGAGIVFFDGSEGITRTNLGLGLPALTNTNVTNFRTAIGLGESNYPRFAALRIGDTNISFESTIEDEGINWYFNRGTNAPEPAITIGYFSNSILSYLPVQFQYNNHAATTRTNLGLGATWLTNTNVTTFRTAIEAAKLHPNGSGVAEAAFGLWDYGVGLYAMQFNNGQVVFGGNSTISNFRTSLNLGETNTVTFAGVTNNGDIRINQTTPTNGLLFVYRTNNEPFLGLANLIASNNVTVSNETLFRVGVAEATNRSAQFGFRSTNTNGNGVAVFSVFGYNALMMIGPSDPNAGTNPIQATVYSISPTNKVMTLITTNTGAMQMHRPIGIDTAGVSTNAPANTTNVAGWIQFYVGTNSVRVPYYQ